MSRISQCFDKLRSAQRKALIPFMTCGHPSPDATVPLMHTLVNAGADIIELGMPFSDPMADGPVIQKAGENALAQGMSLAGVLDCVKQFRTQDSDTPIVLMGYLNPIEAMGYRAFVDAAQSVGVDGVLIVDLPPEEAGDLAPLLEQAQLDPIFLLAPTSSEERIRQVAALARGYVYYVSLKGITGSNQLDVAAVEDKLVTIRQHIELPVGVGFGIKDGATAGAVARVADAAVVGTALVSLMTENADDPDQLHSAVAELLGEMRHAINTVN